MKITSGKYEVHESGTVISFSNEPLTFHLAPDLRVKFNFSKDDNIEKSQITYAAITPQELDVQLINFNDGLDTGNLEPLLVGRLDNRELYLYFRVRSLRNMLSRTMDYCWYLGDIIQNTVNTGGQNG